MGALLVLGASGRTGREVLRLASAAGHEVWAHGRRPPPGADRVLAGPFEDAGLARAIAVAGAILACLASTAEEAVRTRATRGDGGRAGPAAALPRGLGRRGALGR